MDQAPIYDSAVRPPPFVEEFLVLIRYRDLIFQLMSRSVKTRYKRSLLGVAWTMINPLLTMGVLTLVFSSVFKYPGREYALYVLSGLLVWNFFAQSTSAAMVDLVWSGGLIGRVFVPKAVFAVAAIGTGLVNLVLALGAYMLIALILGARIHASLFALGVGLALSSVPIYFAYVTTDWWGAKWAEAAYKAGLIPACETDPDLRFCPNEDLDRAWAAYMMVQVKGGLPLP